jgi:hypothetical protein
MTLELGAQCPTLIGSVPHVAEDPLWNARGDTLYLRNGTTGYIYSYPGLVLQTSFSLGASTGRWTLDNFGNLFWNEGLLIRKRTPDGTVTTVGTTSGLGYEPNRDVMWMAEYSAAPGWIDLLGGTAASGARIRRYSLPSASPTFTGADGLSFGTAYRHDLGRFFVRGTGSPVYTVMLYPTSNPTSGSVYFWNPTYGNIGTIANVGSAFVGQAHDGSFIVRRPDSTHFRMFTPERGFVTAAALPTLPMGCDEWEIAGLTTEFTVGRNAYSVSILAAGGSTEIYEWVSKGTEATQDEVLSEVVIGGPSGDWRYLAEENPPGGHIEKGWPEGYELGAKGDDWVHNYDIADWEGITAQHITPLDHEYAVMFYETYSTKGLYGAIGTSGTASMNLVAVSTFDYRSPFSSIGAGYIQIVNVDDPTNPVHMGVVIADDFRQASGYSYSEADYAAGPTAWKDQYLIVGNQTNPCWFVIDCSTPQAPTIVHVEHVDPGADPYWAGDDPIVIGDRLLFGAITGNRGGTATDGRISTYDISNPVAPVLINELPVPGRIGHMVRDGDYLYACQQNSNKVWSIDISDPDAPFIADTLTVSGSSFRMEIVYLDGRLYLLDDYDPPGSTAYRIAVVDATDPTNLTSLGTFEVASPTGHSSSFGQLGITPGGDLIVPNGSGLGSWRVVDPDTQAVLSTSGDSRLSHAWYNQSWGQYVLAAETGPGSSQVQLSVVSFDGPDMTVIGSAVVADTHDDFETPYPTGISPVQLVNVTLIEPDDYIWHDWLDRNRSTMLAALVQRRGDALYVVQKDVFVGKSWTSTTREGVTSERLNSTDVAVGYTGWYQYNWGDFDGGAYDKWEELQEAGMPAVAVLRRVGSTLEVVASTMDYADAHYLLNSDCLWTAEEGANYWPSYEMNVYQIIRLNDRKFVALMPGSIEEDVSYFTYLGNITTTGWAQTIAAVVFELDDLGDTMQYGSQLKLGIFGNNTWALGDAVNEARIVVVNTEQRPEFRDASQIPGTTRYWVGLHVRTVDIDGLTATENLETGMHRVDLYNRGFSYLKRRVAMFNDTDGVLLYDRHADLQPARGWRAVTLGGYPSSGENYVTNGALNDVDAYEFIGLDNVYSTGTAGYTSSLATYEPVATPAALRFVVGEDGSVSSTYKPHILDASPGRFEDRDWAEGLKPVTYNTVPQTNIAGYGATKKNGHIFTNWSVGVQYVPEAPYLWAIPTKFIWMGTWLVLDDDEDSGLAKTGYRHLGRYGESMNWQGQHEMDLKFFPGTDFVTGCPSTYEMERRVLDGPGLSPEYYPGYPQHLDTIHDSFWDNRTPTQPYQGASTYGYYPLQSSSGSWTYTGVAPNYYVYTPPAFSYPWAKMLAYDEWHEVGRRGVMDPQWGIEDVWDPIDAEYGYVDGVWSEIVPPWYDYRPAFYWSEISEDYEWLYPPAYARALIWRVAPPGGELHADVVDARVMTHQE